MTCTLRCAARVIKRLCSSWLKAEPDGSCLFIYLSFIIHPLSFRVAFAGKTSPNKFNWKRSVTIIACRVQWFTSGLAGEALFLTKSRPSTGGTWEEQNTSVSSSSRLGTPAEAAGMASPGWDEYFFLPTESNKNEICTRCRYSSSSQILWMLWERRANGEELIMSQINAVIF